MSASEFVPAGIETRCRAPWLSETVGGSGTTLIAAERTGRRERVLELDPKYADVIAQRWQEQTGQSARLEQSGRNFSEMASKKIAVV